MREGNKLTALGVAKRKTPGRYSDGHGLWLQVSSEWHQGVAVPLHDQRAGSPYGARVRSTLSTSPRPESAQGKPDS